MTPELADALRLVARAVLKALDGPDDVATSSGAVAQPADFTCQQIGERFGRSASTVRTWLEQGRFPGAYKLNRREWRIPVAALATFEESARTPATPQLSRAGRKPVSLGAWRSVS